MGLLKVPKLQNMYILAQREHVKVYGNVVGTRERLWERVWDLVWEHGSVHVNLFGNDGACVGKRLGTREQFWELFLGTNALAWDITLVRVHYLHTILIIFNISWHCTTLHATYVECCMTHLQKAVH